MNNKLIMLSKQDGEGRPLLLVPGGLTGWVSWEPFVPVFTAKERKVIRVQLLSVQYGLDNLELPSDYSVKTESLALRSAIEGMNIHEPIDIVAWSFGAFTSLDFALDNPEYIRTLTLIEPPAVWLLRETASLDNEITNILDFFSGLHGNISEDMLEKFLIYAGFSEPGKSVRELPQWKNWLPYRQSLRNSPAVVSFRDKISRLKILDKPVLLVKGTGSAKFLHNIIDILSSNLNNSKVVEFPGGHAPHIVSREDFLNELEKFQNK